MSWMSRICGSLLFVTVISVPTAHALSVTLGNLILVPPAAPVNQSTITLTTDSIGSDSDTVTLSGQISAELEFQFVNGMVVPTGLSFTGGTVNISDSNYSLAFGVVQVSATGLAGTPITLSPPGTVTGNTYPASDHNLVVNQGVVAAAGNMFDFATSPATFTGDGIGLLDVTTMPGPGPLPSYLVSASIELPLDINASYTLTDVPIFGTVQANLSGQTLAVATETLILDLIVGDYNQDSQLDCEDAAMLSAAVAGNSTDLTYDANLDGIVSSLDVSAWATDLVHTIPGDANLDFNVDGGDFLAWNANKFTGGTNWCSGDFDGDGTTNGADFLVWNANKFTSADHAQRTVVPEPQFLTGLFLVSLLLWRNRS